MELRVGDCLNGEEPFVIVGCNESHTGQVYEQVKLGAPGDPYPPNVSELIRAGCSKLPQASLRTDVSDLRFTYWAMNQSAWTSFVAVTAPCIAKFDPPEFRSLLR